MAGFLRHVLRHFVCSFVRSFVCFVFFLGQVEAKGGKEAAREAGEDVSSAEGPLSDRIGPEPSSSSFMEWRSSETTPSEAPLLLRSPFPSGHACGHAMAQETPCSPRGHRAGPILEPG